MKRRRAVLAVVIAFALATGCVWAQEPGGQETFPNVQVTVDGNPVSFTGPVL
ncbi:MAG: hypothetical protein GF393_12115, partial [Armatimonadia bacterium]|nr:hypothetical protein [Armatimonadia bacterium]